MYADRQEVYEEEEKKQLEAQLKELEGLVNEMGEISGNAVIDPTLFSSLDNALKPGNGTGIPGVSCRRRKDPHKDFNG